MTKSKEIMKISRSVSVFEDDSQIIINSKAELLCFGIFYLLLQQNRN